MIEEGRQRTTPEGFQATFGGLRAHAVAPSKWEKGVMQSVTKRGVSNTVIGWEVALYALAKNRAP